MKKLLPTRLTRMARVLAMTAAAGATLAFSSAANAQIPVTDIALNVQQVLAYAEQLLQYAGELEQYANMVEQYELQLTNLTKLPGTIRTEIQSGLEAQLVSNLNDFGVSYLGQLPQLAADTSTFYANAETLYKNAYSSTPRTMATATSTMSAVGLPTDMSSPMYKGAYQDRMTWEKLLDNMRQSAVMRQNAQNRSTQANSITSQMQALPDNNTVGALQLIAGQASLAYAQNEDLLKTTSQTLRVLQEKDAQTLSEADVLRQHELDRLAAIQSRPLPTGGTIPSF